jgi:ABC-type transport system substrate-binding protein
MGPTIRLTVKVATRKHRAVPRPGGHPHRPDEADLCRWRARYGRNRELVPEDRAEGFFPVCGNIGTDPDAYFFEHYACGSERNYTNYCNPELEKMYEQQSMERDQDRRKKLVWEIDRRLQEDAARPMIYNYRLATCSYPRVHDITVMVNSLFNGWRFEDAWLER